MRIENSFIPVRGVGETTEQTLWSNGITHWSEFGPRGGRAVVGATLGERIERFIDDGWSHLDDGNVEFFADSLPVGSRWRLYENCRAKTCFLDIETTGLDPQRNRVTTVSVHRDGDTRTYVQGNDLTASRLAREFEAADLLVTFNGKRFDVPFLESNFDVEATLPHVDLLYPCKSVGLTGGLKAIERRLDIDRDRPDLSGRDAVRLWHEYERGNEDALNALVEYNRADTVNMERLMDIVTGRLHEAVFESVLGDENGDGSDPKPRPESP